MKTVEFQRRHFEFIAAVISAMNDGHQIGREASIEASGAFACALSATNPNFDREKFLAACGVGRD